MESIKHKLGKKLAAKLLNGREECPIRKGHRADACNNKSYIEVDCKKKAGKPVCELNWYPKTCLKVDGEVKCQAVTLFRF